MTLQQRRRGTKHFSFAISALLCVLFLAGWARSRWVGDELRYTNYRQATFTKQWVVAHGGGDFVICHWSGHLLTFVAPPRWQYVRSTTAPVRYNLPDYVHGLFGYGVCRHRPRSSLLQRYDALVLPYWLPALVTGMPWLIVAWRHWASRAARRIAAGLCPACGYDLRASENRCPECGAARTGQPTVVAGAA
jgi:hypothetical protein